MTDCRKSVLTGAHVIGELKAPSGKRSVRMEMDEKASVVCVEFAPGPSTPPTEYICLPVGSCRITISK